MRPRTRPIPRPAGFTMIELLIVAGVIAVMAAVALPNIAGYLRQAKVRGASGQVVGELQRARNKAVVKNTNEGVAFAVLDANSYRFNVIDDERNTPPAPPTVGRGLSPLLDLPQGVTFVAGANNPVFGIGFDRLGRRCDLGTAGCAAAQTVAGMCIPAFTEGGPRCTDHAAGLFIDTDAVGNALVRVREDATGLIRVIRVEVGGRVMEQR